MAALASVTVDWAALTATVEGFEVGTGMLVLAWVVAAVVELLIPLVGALSDVSEAEVIGVGVVLQDVLQDEELAVSLVSLLRVVVVHVVESGEAVVPVAVVVLEAVVAAVVMFGSELLVLGSAWSDMVLYFIRLSLSEINMKIGNNFISESFTSFT